MAALHPKARLARAELLRRKCKRSIKVLCHYLWPILEPSRELEWGHHHTAIAKHLEALWRGDKGTNGRAMQRLLLAIPPGSLKTTLVQIIFPLWVWLQDPTQRFLVGSLSDALAKKSALKRQNILKSALWEDLNPEFDILKDTLNECVNTQTGFIQTTTPKAKITGQHADWYLVDDPQPASPTKAEVDLAVTWYTDVLQSRTTDARSLREVIVHQRVHQRDLIGFLVDEQGLLTTDALFVLQAEYDPTPKISPTTPWGQVDWRTIPGESIHPDRLPDDVMAKHKRRPRRWSTQYQQSPIVGHGEFIDDRWWRFYRELPAKIDWWIGAFDTAETTKDSSDWTVGHVFAISGSRIYLVDRIKGRWSTLQVAANVKAFRDRYPQCTKWYIELASSGRAVKEILDRAGGRMVPVKHTQSKEARVLGVQGFIEAGQVYLPDKTLNPWVEELIAEASAFPNATHDDEIDCLTTGLRQIARYVQVDLSADLGDIFDDPAAAGQHPAAQPPPRAAPPPPTLPSPSRTPRTSPRRTPRPSR